MPSKIRDIAEILGVTETSNTTNAILTSTADGSGGVTVYSTKEDLPSSGLTAGDQAYVTANSRFYISNGSGWYNVALVNATPALAIDPTGDITLSNTGDATTITLTATDSDNAVAGLTYSVESDGSFGGLATISQDSSVFTITPLSEDSATTTSAVLTFKASDGISFGSGSRTLILSFKVIYSNYTTLLLKNEETTDNQVDASTNAHTITENGDVKSTAFSPYHPGGYSVYFDGAGDYIRYSNAVLAEGTDDFTLECWLYRIGSQAQNDAVFGHDTTPGYQISFGTSNDLRFDTTPSGGDEYLNTGTLDENRWYHVVYQRASGVLQGFLDGVSLGTRSLTTNFTNTTIDVGVNRDGTSYFKGYLRDVRIVKGTAVYSSSGFTPPTRPLTAISGTSLLTCHAPYIADGSSNNISPTVNGNTSTERFGPYDYLSYSKADHAGSVYFDGTGDYGVVTADTSFQVVGGDFTIEAWIYPQSVTGEHAIFMADDNSSTGQQFQFRTSSDGFQFITWPTSARSPNTTVTVSSCITINQWHHIAVTNDSGTLRIFINGSLQSTTGSWSAYAGNVNLGIGASNDGDIPFQGYISDARIVKGTAVYTSSFTPPTAPLTAIANTGLLTCTNKNDIWDAGTGTVFTKAGDVTGGANSGTLKFNKTAMYFDGTGDYLTFSEGGNFGTDDWTIEAWVYRTGTATRSIFAHNSSNTASTGFNFVVNSSQQLGAYWGSAYQATVDSFPANQWVHVAATYDGTNLRLFVDGVLGDTSPETINFTTDDFWIGNSQNSQYWQGYLQDVRITKGLARYTSSFTPPTAEFNA